MRIKKTIIVVISTICMVTGSLGSLPFTSYAADETQPGNAAAEQNVVTPEVVDETKPAETTVSEEPTDSQTEDGETPSASDEDPTTSQENETDAGLPDKLTKEIKASDGRTYVVTVSGLLESGIPANAELLVEEVLNPEISADAKELEKKPEKEKTKEDKEQIERNSHYSDYVEQSAKVLKEKADALSFALPFDIKLIDPETKEEYQPSADLKVAIQLADVELKKDAKINVIHFDEEDGKAAYEKDKTKLEEKVKEGDKKAAEQLEEAKLHSEIGSPEKLKTKTKEDVVAFTTDGFSVYVVVTETKKQVLTASDGTTYNITAAYDYTAGIPKDAELVVSEIADSDNAYADYIAKSAKAIEKKEDKIQYAKALDIYFVDPATGKHITPGKDVKINIEVLDTTFEEDTEVSVVHFGDEVEVVDTNVKGQNVAFANDAFSVYVVLNYTVDFHWGNYTYSIAGEDSILLSELFEKLDVKEITVEDVENVTFSNPELLKVEKVEADSEKELADDWKLTSVAPFDTEETLSLQLKNGETVKIEVTDEPGDEEGDDEEGEDPSEGDNTPTVNAFILSKELIYFEGNKATWEINVNRSGSTLNNGEMLTLQDAFNTENPLFGEQTVDYSTVQITGDNVIYDYNDSVGTFLIPDATPVKISYRTRVKFDEPGETIRFGGEARLLKDEDTVIALVNAEEERVVYPSPSDVATTTGNNELNLYVYEEGNMQHGLAGARFILMDANQRFVQYDVTDPSTALLFPESGAGTDETGFTTVRADQSRGVTIEKNTLYYLEMIQVPEGYRKDNALYSFMITDNPDYNSGGVSKFYNGDTMKICLQKESAGLNVAMRFSGNFELPEELLNQITVILEKKAANGSWEEIERHTIEEFENGSINFDYGCGSEAEGENLFEIGATYRVRQINDAPWVVDPDRIAHEANYFVVTSGSEANLPEITPIEFTVTEDMQTKGIDAIIINKYEERKLSITKMNKDTGETLPGAVFTVRKASDDSDVTSFITDDNGELTIVGSDLFKAETLYYIVETKAPEGYLLPKNPVRTYFYFCNDDVLRPQFLKDLPADKTAVNLTESYDRLFLGNQQATRTIAVMKTWRANRWPESIASVEVGLYQTVNGETTQVKDGNEPLTVTLTADVPYDSSRFKDLPTADEDGNPIEYSIKEEKVTATDGSDVLDQYVRTYGISDAGVFIVHNSEATTLRVNKEWYDSADQKITDLEELAKQPDVIFDIYRTSWDNPVPDSVREDGITNEEMALFIKERNLKPLISNVTFGNGDGWTKLVQDGLSKYDDFDNTYNYYVMETVPSFGDEVYEVDEEGGEVLIKNKTLPETVPVTVKLEKLVDDPRPDSQSRNVNFTLTLKKESRVIRNYTVTDGAGNSYQTDWNGEMTFTLKPDTEIVLNLPLGVTAEVTEAIDSEFEVDATSEDIQDLEPDVSETFRFIVTPAVGNKKVSFTNKLRVVCKVVDTSGAEITFESLKSALAYIRSHTDTTYVGGVATIQMIEDYTMPSWDEFSVQGGEKIVLTTAKTAAEDLASHFPFKTKRTEDTSTAIITRGKEHGSLFENTGALALYNIIIDGAKATYTVGTNGGLIQNAGTLNLGENTILRNSKITGDSAGGAIYSTGTVKMTEGRIYGNAAPSGSAIYLVNNGVLEISGGTIEENTGAIDGAVVVDDLTSNVRVFGNPVIFGNTNAQEKAANLYISVDSNAALQVITPGLGESAKIGVRAMEGHRDIGDTFASTERTTPQNLNCFINDFYEYRGKQKDGSPGAVVWDGLILNINKILTERGGNTNDRFTITLSSAAIKKSNYTVDGTFDVTITPAKRTTPGSIVLKNVDPSKPIKISPLPVGSYTITEADSAYTPAYTGVNDDTHEAIAFDNRTFYLEGNSTVNVTNTRRMAPVNLTNILQNSLIAADEGYDFSVTVKLTEPDGSAVSGFALADGVVTNANGEATITMSPTNATPAQAALEAPVGTTVRIIETNADDYHIATDAHTKPGREGGDPIEDQDPEHENTFQFALTDDGAAVEFTNVRKSASIELRNDLVYKTSNDEAFSVNVTLRENNGAPLKNFVVYRDPVDESKNIVTDSEGKAVLPFVYPDGVTSGSYQLSLPEGTKITVAEDPVEKNVDGRMMAIYDTTYAVDGTQQPGSSATIDGVTEANKSIVITNTRWTRTVTVTNTVSGYAGNLSAFEYVATITDGSAYSSNEFENGVLEFGLSTDQSKTLTVPYGAQLKIEEIFIPGYYTTCKHGDEQEIANKLIDEFQISANVTVAYANRQMIGLRIENKTRTDLQNVRVYVEKGTEAYRVRDDKSGQDRLNIVNKWITLDRIEAGHTAILAIEHIPPSGTTIAQYMQKYQVTGNTPADDFFYTIENEPSYHEYAQPAMQRVYNVGTYDVSGQLRYSIEDSRVTISEQSLVNFDANGGAWTNEMDGYHDKDGTRQVYQMAVEDNTAVARPTVDPVYPTEENIPFLGWTTDKAFAEADHTATEDVSAKLYNFATKVTGPFTLYAIWARPARNNQIVTLKNSYGNGERVSITLTLMNGNTYVRDYLFDSRLNPTDRNGQTSFTMGDGVSVNLVVPKNYKLILQSDKGIVYSTNYTDGDNSASNASFTIDSVTRDGTVSVIRGICKITGADGRTLTYSAGYYGYYGTAYAVYPTLEAAFNDFDSQTFNATPVAVKMLIDEYTIEKLHKFPTKRKVTITTARKDDLDFPYAGVRDRSILRRKAGWGSNCMFTLEGETGRNTARNVTLEKIILDGNNVALSNFSGGIINVNQTNGVLTIANGVELRNARYNSYSNGSCIGAGIYIELGTLNVYGGTFKNLTARRGGALYVTGSATLNMTGEAGGTLFEDCKSNGDDGGALYYGSSNHLVINGGTDRSNPHIVFNRCVAQTKEGDGGAIYCNENESRNVTVKGCDFIECKAEVDGKNSTDGNGGGGIAAYRNMSLNVEACHFADCDTLVGGGSIVARVKKTNTANNRAVSIINCLIERSNCRAQGGALAVYQSDNNDSDTCQTELYIEDTEFNNCSSGTNNGSGGAIQSYVPCVTLDNSIFKDCWAGKEGGAINNWYGSGRDKMWAKSYLKAINCQFIRCRAEDRYDTEPEVHYGGAIASKTRMMTIEGSYFEACVSTLKQGGAVHCSGIGDGTKMTLKDSTFKDCTALDNGGAAFAINQTMSVEGCTFINCNSYSKNGGAIGQGNGVNKPSNFTLMEIKDSTFEGTGAAISGGAAWTEATTTTVSGCTFNGCSAAADGGAIYAKTAQVSDSAKGTCTITDCQAGNNGGAIYESTSNDSVIKANISGCSAKNGSAVYCAAGTTTFTGGTITGNTVSELDSAAIHCTKMYFENNVKVEENPCSADSENKHDVLLKNDNATTIYTTNNGLTSDAHIGVYVTNAQDAKRGIEGKAFGTYGGGNGSRNLDRFFNDRRELFGYQISGSDTNIYWGFYVCKITNEAGDTLNRPSGAPAVYPQLRMAVGEFKDIPNAKYVKMLVQYYPLQEGTDNQVNNFPNEELILTTASKDDPQHPYKGEEGSVCTISRRVSDTSTTRLFTVNTTGATFILENITLDGNNKAASKAGYGLIEATAGRVVVNSGTTFQNVYTGNKPGAAINVSNVAAFLDIDSSNGDILFDNCNSGSANGGAVLSEGVTTISGTETGGRTTFRNCNANNGGAVYLNYSNNYDPQRYGVWTIEYADFKDCSSLVDGGAFMHTRGTAYIEVVVRHCSFENCSSLGDTGNNGGGGAITSKTESLTVVDCQFTNCTAKTQGGAIDHGVDKSKRTKTEIIDSTFNNCQAVGNTNGSRNYGGAVYTRAKQVVIGQSDFRNITANNHGGAVYIEDNEDGSSATISGTTFDNCKVTRTDRSGGAIFTNGKTVTIQDAVDNGGNVVNSRINACVATSYSGAVYMNTKGEKNKLTVLNITGGTVISGCYADKGAAIYLKNGITMNLSGKAEFAQNGFMTTSTGVVNAREGACIYLEEGSLLNLSGTLKFSKNNITNIGTNSQERISNGGVLDYVRQDIFLAGYSGKAYATSINIAGELDGDTIWVWPQFAPHRTASTLNNSGQFAKADSAISESSLGKFRNALPDGTAGSGCENGEFLAGVRKEGDTENAYWNAMFSMSFNKVDDEQGSVADAEFTLFKDANFTEVLATAVSADGETTTDSHSELLERGTVEFSAIPIGIYYMKETKTPSGYEPNNDIYLALVGTPALTPNPDFAEFWAEGGPLDVQDAARKIQNNTYLAGKNYGVYRLNGDNRAEVDTNLGGSFSGIVNVLSNFESFFMKVDNNGIPMANAEFSVYTQMTDESGRPQSFQDGFPKLTPYTREGREFAPVKSATENSGKTKLDGSKVEKGLVYFRDLPVGTYYLMETDYPGRNGNNRIAFFVETERVYRLVVTGESEFNLSERQPNGTYVPITRKTAEGYCIVDNQEVVSKLEAENKDTGKTELLYTKAHSVYVKNDEGELVEETRVFPAIYTTLEDAFEAAHQETGFVDGDGEPVSQQNLENMELHVLKDFTLTQPITIERKLTVTTARREAPEGDPDKYVFSTDRTTDPSTALIKRGYSDNLPDRNAGALFTVDKGAKVTLQNILLDGQKDKYTGRALYVKEGELDIHDRTTVRNFKQEAPANSTGQNDIRGGALLVEDRQTVKIDGGFYRTVEFSGNEVINNRASGSTGAEGGAIACNATSEIEIVNVKFTGNTAKAAKEEKGNGGAISFTGVQQGGNPLKLDNAVFTKNEASYSGGAVQVNEYAVVTSAGSTFNGNKAEFGAAISAAGHTDVMILDSSIQENVAKNEGSAVYAANRAKVTISGGVITGNEAQGAQGGAINVGGTSARLYFEGKPFLFGNTYRGSTIHRNVVLNYDSVEIINTTEKGLLKDGIIGVYIMNDALYSKRGGPDGQFGTFGEDGKGSAKNLNVFRNDRNLALYGVKKDNLDNIRWTGAVCKLTDVDSGGNDELLYQKLSIKIPGVSRRVEVYTPAVYGDVQEGFNAAQGKLWRRDSNDYTEYYTFNDNSLKLKLLVDVTLDEKGLVYEGKRKVAFTTAENKAQEYMRYAEEFLFYTEDVERNKAVVRRMFGADNPKTDGPMIKVNGTELTLTEITLDGNGYDNTGNLAYRTAKPGGIADVTKGSLIVTDGALLMNSVTSGNGGAIYVRKGASAVINSGSILANRAAKGGAVYGVKGSVMTINGGIITGNKAETKGAGVYLAEGSKLYISGNPNFGGPGVSNKGLSPENGNFVILDTEGELDEEGVLLLTNGDMEYAKNDEGEYVARQDIFIEGYKEEEDAEEENPAKSLIITGPLTSADGSIWVWAEENPHYIMQEQFARVEIPNEDDASEVYLARVYVSLKAFRNARSDGKTQNNTRDYLRGVINEKNKRDVLWSGGTRRVILRKVNAKHESLAGAQFTVYKLLSEDPDTPVVTVKLDDGTNKELRDLESTESGIFWTGVLPYGTYYIKETVAPNGYTAGRWFVLTVSAEGVGYEKPDPDNPEETIYEHELKAETEDNNP